MEENDGPSRVITKKAMLIMVCEAVEAVAVPRKGASVIAIKNYIQGKYLLENSTRFKSNVKKAITDAISEEFLIRPKGQEEYGASLQGSFKIGSKKSHAVPNKKPKENKPKTIKKKVSKEKSPVKSKSTKRLSLKTKPRLTLSPIQTNAKKGKPKAKKAAVENETPVGDQTIAPTKASKPKKVKSKSKPEEVKKKVKPTKKRTDSTETAKTVKKSKKEGAEADSVETETAKTVKKSKKEGAEADSVETAKTVKKLKKESAKTVLKKVESYDWKTPKPQRGGRQKLDSAASDTEVTVIANETGRKSTRLYLSDTELSFTAPPSVKEKKTKSKK